MIGPARGTHRPTPSERQTSEPIVAAPPQRSPPSCQASDTKPESLEAPPGFEPGIKDLQSGYGQSLNRY